MRREPRLWVLLVLLGLSTSALPAEQPEAVEDPLAGEAAAFGKLFLEGEYERIHVRMTAEMRAAITLERAEEIRADLLRNGAVERIGEAWLEAVSEGYRRYRVPVYFRETALDLRVVFDDEGKVAGFFRTSHVEPSSDRVARKQEPAPEFLGHWEGSIETPGTALTVLVDLSFAEGYWSGTADIPMQGAKGLPLTKIRVAGKEIEFALADIPGDPTFRGTLAGGEITGTFLQGGMSFAFSLGREELPTPARPQEPRAPLPYGEEEVTYENGDITLAGTLTLPSEGGPAPAVVLISGSGPQDRNEEVLGHKPFLILADHLTRAGIAVLRVDDRGVGGSTGSHEGSTSEDFATDALAGVDYLRGRPEIDSKRIGLVGHSEGGIIAPLVASRSDKIAFIVMLAGTGVPGDEVLLLQTELISRTTGIGEENLARMLEAHRQLTAAVKSGADTERVRALARKLVEAQLGNASSDSADEAVEQTVIQMSGPWFRFFLDYDPRPALRKVRVPVLALNGELDLQVDPDQNLPAIREALEQAGNRDVTAVELPGLNHLFQKAKTGAVQEYYTIEETMNPAALKAVSEWILARFGESSGPR